MRGKKDKKIIIIRLVSRLLSMLLGAVLLMSAAYLYYFLRTSYTENISRFRDNGEHYRSEIDDTLTNLNRQIQWLATNAGELDYWNNVAPYEQMLYQRRLKTELTNFSRVTDGVEAVVIQKRNSDVMLETHSVDDGMFLSFLERINGFRTAVPQSMTALTAGDGSDYIFVSAPIETYDEMMFRHSVVADVYALFRIDGMFGRDVPNGTCILCREYNGTYRILAQWGNYIAEADTVPFPEENDTRIVFGGEKWYAHTAELVGGNLYMIYLMPSSSVMRNVIRVVISGTVIVAMIFALVLYCIITLTANIRNPLAAILGDMSLVRTGGYEYRLRESDVHEFDEIAASVNSVLDELKKKNAETLESQKKLYELELINRENRMQALQSQINPHFLYNTLECVNAIARFRDVPEITRIIDGMIYIYRYSASFDHMGTVHSEMDCARSYAEIINVRYDGMYTFEFFEDESVSDTEMPKIILQPLLENAIVHGMIEGDREGKITVSARNLGDRVELIIRDNGAGIPEEKLRKLEEDLSNGTGTEHKPGRIGLFNVHTRLRSGYGEPYGIRIRSEEGVFTEVCVTVPAGKGDRV